MKTRFKFLTYTVLAMALTMTSCQKEETAQDPEAVDETYEIEIENKAKGTSVKYQMGGDIKMVQSNWFGFNPNVKVGRQYEMQFYGSKGLGKFIDDGGLVLGYYSHMGSGLNFNTTRAEISLMPYHDIFSDIVRTISASTDNRIMIRVKATNRTSPYGDDQIYGKDKNVNTSRYRYKYVLIGGVTGGTELVGKSQQPDFKNMTYNEVMDHFGADY